MFQGKLQLDIKSGVTESYYRKHCKDGNNAQRQALKINVNHIWSNSESAPFPDLIELWVMPGKGPPST